MGTYRVGGVLVFAEESGSRLAEIVAVNSDGTYDLSTGEQTRRHVSAQKLRHLGGGELVQYLSASINDWIDAQVLRKGVNPGTYDLNCKEAVHFSRIRVKEQPAPAREERASTPISRQPSAKEGAQNARAVAALQNGDQCFYKSASHGWIPAKVTKQNPDSGTTDLDVKYQVRPEQIRPIAEGQEVEYHSSSQKTWIPAKVLRKGRLPGTWDLDVKESAELTRVRPLDQVAPAPPGETPVTAPPARASQQPLAAADLRKAVARRDAAAIKVALEKAAAVGLPEKETEAAAKVLQELEERAPALEAVEQAQQTRDPQVLREAIQAAQAVGVADEDLVGANRLLHSLEAEAREREEAKARQELREAESVQDPERLRAAISRGERAGLCEPELLPMRQLLHGLENPVMTQPQMGGPVGEIPTTMPQVPTTDPQLPVTDPQCEVPPVSAAPGLKVSGADPKPQGQCQSPGLLGLLFGDGAWLQCKGGAR